MNETDKTEEDEFLEALDNLADLNKKISKIDTINGNISIPAGDSFQMRGDSGDWGSSMITSKGDLALSDGVDNHVLTAQMLKRLIEMVKAEFPEDDL